MVRGFVEPLRPSDAKVLIRSILKSGSVSFSRHALEEMNADDLTTVDCTNVMRGGVVQPGELREGSYRYRVETSRICVVVAFRSKTHLVVVTAWRLQK